MKNLGTKRLETDRLILRKFKIEDALDVYNSWASDSNVTKYVSFNPHKDVNETQEILTQWIKEYDNNSFNWVVELKNTYELIGSVSIMNIKEKHENCEVGYVYGSKYWGNGYATEALKAVLKYMLNDCEFHLVEARHYETNPASGKVMGKAGMKKEAILRERRKNKNTVNFDNLVVYSIVKEDL